MNISRSYPVGIPEAMAILPAYIDFSLNPRIEAFLVSPAPQEPQRGAGFFKTVWHGHCSSHSTSTFITGGLRHEKKIFARQELMEVFTASDARILDEHTHQGA